MGGEALINNGLHVASQPQVLLPNYSAYTGTPSNVANLKVKSNVPAFLQENELKFEVLKKQHICQAQVNAT